MTPDEFPVPARTCVLFIGCRFHLRDLSGDDRLIAPVMGLRSVLDPRTGALQVHQSRNKKGDRRPAQDLVWVAAQDPCLTSFLFVFGRPVQIASEREAQLRAKIRGSGLVC